jgi:uncharacterized protein
MSTPEDSSPPPSLPPGHEFAGHEVYRPDDSFSVAPQPVPPGWQYFHEFPPPRPQPLSPGPLPRGWLMAVMAGLVGYLSLWFIGDLFGIGEGLRLFAMSGLESLPFLPLTVFAYLGRQADWAKMLTGAYWFVVVGGAALMVWLVTLESLPSGDPLRNMASGRGPPVEQLLLHAGSILLAPLALLGVGLGVLIGLAGFHPLVRRLAARVIPIDPGSFVHATALATVFGLTAISFVPLLVLGEPPLLTHASIAEEMNRDSDETEDSELRSTVYSFVWLVPCTIVAVGYPVRRSFRDALRRIGLVRPKVWQIGLAIVLVPALVAAMNIVDNLVEHIWTLHDWPTTNSKAFDQMMRFAFNSAGAIVVGVTAGLGEELTVRGVLQPRLGIVLSNLFFTSLHALQYNWDGLLSVFLIGLTLGILRKYTNTTTSAILHGGYDYVLVMLEVFHAGAGAT